MKKRVKKWNSELIRERALPYSSRSDFALNDKAAYEAARYAGLLDDLFDSKLKKWDVDLVTKEAKKYATRSEFALGSGSAYNAARRLGILASLFDSQLLTWTEEEISKVAEGCLNKKELKRKCGSAYNAALRLGLIDVLFPENVSTGTRDCVYLWSVVDEPGLYKVGITSKRMGTYRIQQVAKEAKVTPELVMLCEVGYEQAKVIEREMKSMGTPYKFQSKFYGHTEFRYLTPDEVSRCIKLTLKNKQNNS